MSQAGKELGASKLGPPRSQPGAVPGSTLRPAVGAHIFAPTAEAPGALRGAACCSQAVWGSWVPTFDQAAAFSVLSAGEGAGEAAHGEDGFRGFSSLPHFGQLHHGGLWTAFFTSNRGDRRLNLSPVPPNPNSVGLFSVEDRAGQTPLIWAMVFRGPTPPRC